MSLNLRQIVCFNAASSLECASLTRVKRVSPQSLDSSSLLSKTPSRISSPVSSPPPPPRPLLAVFPFTMGLLRSEDRLNVGLSASLQPSVLGTRPTESRRLWRSLKHREWWFIFAMSSAVSPFWEVWFRQDLTIYATFMASVEAQLLALKIQTACFSDGLG